MAPRPDAAPRLASTAKPSKSRKGKHRAQEIPPACTGANVGPALAPWPWIALAEPNVSSHPAVFTKDSKYFFTIAASSVKIYSVATGKVVSTLSSVACSTSPSTSSSNGHTGLVTSIALNPHNPLQLLTSSLDGSIKTWDFLDASLLGTVHVGSPITHMCPDPQIRDQVFVATASGDSKEQRVLRVSLVAQRKPNSPTGNITTIGTTTRVTSLAISPSAKWLVVTGGVNAYVHLTSSSGFTKFVSSDKLTTLAFHPSEEYFATGDERGQIRLWYCLDEELLGQNAAAKPRAQTTFLHWHAHAVSSIAFSLNGAYLLSGGEEAVLVIWQLHSRKKEFVPRIGAPIASIAVSQHSNTGEGYLLALTDGRMVLIDSSTLAISKEMSGIRFGPPPPSRSSACPLAIHEQSATILLPSSHPSSIQFYDPLGSTLIAELEISPSNRVSRRDQEEISPSRVEHISVCPSGRWLATLDSRDGDQQFGPEIHLKFWYWDDKTWSLNTRVDRPHGSSAVTAMSFNPAGRDEETWHLATVGEDVHVKTWRPAMSQGASTPHWFNRSSLSYRSQVPRDVAWAPDGSLLAAAHNASIALFDPSSGTLLKTLTCTEVREINRVAFVGQTGRYIVVSGKRELVVWDLISCSVSWHFSSDHIIQHITPHPHDNSFALVRSPPAKANTSMTSEALIFAPSSPIPRISHSLPFALRRLAFFSPAASSSSEFGLVAIAHDWRVVLIGDATTPLDARTENAAKGILDDGSGQRRTLFQDIFGKSAFTDVETHRAEATVSSRREPHIRLRGAFGGPSYLSPPIEELFDLSMLVKKRPVDPPPIAEAMDVDAPVSAPAPIIEATNVPGEEINMLVDLFKDTLLKSFASRPPSSAYTNGNGVHPSNGVQTKSAGLACRRLRHGVGVQLDPEQIFVASSSFPVGVLLEHPQGVCARVEKLIWTVPRGLGSAHVLSKTLPKDMLIHVLGTSPIASLLAFHLRRLGTHTISLFTTTGAWKNHATPTGAHIVVENSGALSSETHFSWEPWDSVPDAVYSLVFNKKGRLVRPTHDHPYPVPVDKLQPSDSHIESLIVTTRAASVCHHMERLRSRLNSASTIVLLQDGMGIYDALVRRVFRNPSERPNFVLAYSSHRVWKKAQHHVVHDRTGQMHFGIAPDSRGRDFERSYDQQGVDVHERALSLEDICPVVSQDESDRRYHSLRETITALSDVSELRPQWLPISALEVQLQRQLVVHCAVQPLTALMGCRAGDLLGPGPARSIITSVCREASAVFAKQSTVDSTLGPLHRRRSALETNELFAEVERYCRLSARDITPMMQQFQRGLSTDVEFMNGYLKDLGAKYKVPTPAVSMLYSLVKLGQTMRSRNRFLELPAL